MISVDKQKQKCIDQQTLYSPPAMVPKAVEAVQACYESYESQVLT